MTNESPDQSTLQRRAAAIEHFLGHWASRPHRWFVQMIGIAPPRLHEQRWAMRWRLFLDIWSVWLAKRDELIALATAGLAEIERGAKNMQAVRRNVGISED